MSGKNFDTFQEELTPEQSKFHIVIGGNLYLINFDVNQSNLRLEHGPIIDRLVVPFIMRAVKRLGPGSYNLNVIGSASATGTSEHNYTLGSSRAYNAAMYAIRAFEKLQKTDPGLTRVELRPNTTSVGSDLSKPEAKLLHLEGSTKVENKQSHFRSVMFRFKAGLQHPAGASVFQIREIYFFKFQKIEEPMPEVLKKIDKALDNPVIKFFIDQAIERAFKKFFDAIGPLGVVAKHMISFMIPRGVDYCLEVKDYRDRHALYRYHGVEHKDSLGISELIGFVSKVHGVLAALAKVAKGVEGLGKAMDALGKTTEEMIEKAIALVRVKAGDQMADTVKSILELIKEGKLLDSFVVPTSAWNPFKFHDNGPDHDVAKLEGPARRNAVDLGLHSAVDIEFGGFVPNNWTDFNAEARFKTPFSLRNGLFGIGTSQGTFFILRGPYFGDVVPGLINPITG